MAEQQSALVTAAWLAERLGDPSIRVIDTRWYLTEPGRGRSEYLAAHIPGALYLDIDMDLSAPRGHGPGRHPLPTPESFALVAGKAGIGPQTHVVAYDAAGGAYAARVWWLLRYFSHPAVSVLDGGWPAWVASGNPTAAGEQVVAPAIFIPRPRPEMVVNAETIEVLRRDPHALVLDVRASERYEGRIEPIDPQAGHIPGARSAPYAGNLATDGRLLNPAELRARYDTLGTASAERLVCYCGSGVTAAHGVLALELAGYSGAQLYEGSWSDWSSDPQRPVATGPDPE